MDILQTYETTITSESGAYSLTVLVIPTRSYGHLADDGFSLHEVAGYLFRGQLRGVSPIPGIEVKTMASIIRQHHDDEKELLLFANYAANAKIIPFEQSPLGPESLSSIAISIGKAGSIGVGATVGLLTAGSTPFLLITVPLGIVLCGASASFVKWMDENRNFIWDRLLSDKKPKQRVATKKRHKPPKRLPKP